MIVYQQNCETFMADVRESNIDFVIHQQFQQKLHRRTSDKEVESWANSMQFMRNVLEIAHIPPDAMVTIECQIPQTSKRIDFILTGLDEKKQSNAVIIELKQWKNAEATEKDAVVITALGKGTREVSHPSYQAWSYADLLTNFNRSVEENQIRLSPCAFLHNCEDRTALTLPFYQTHINKAPIFFKRDVRALADFIKQFVKYGDTQNIMEIIENGEIRPSKALADSVVALLNGKQEFTLIDDQKIVYETALQLVNKAISDKRKQVLIVEGGPGTGKSVVAINLLAKLTGEQKLTHYVSKNSAPRSVYAEKLKGYRTKSSIDNLFKGSGSYIKAKPNQFACLVVDEAHRLNEKSGLYGTDGENQILEIIQSAWCSVFFVDENQRVTLKDIGSKAAIRDWASRQGAEVQEMKLESQFRCGGSDGYLAWLDQALQIRSTANTDLSDINYEFGVCDTATELRRFIEEKNRLPKNTARLVAGYCWKWNSKNNAEAYDIEFPSEGFQMQWNLASDSSLWIVKEESINQIGCIHTCQGLEIDYVGVIIGPDMVIRDGKVVTDPSKRASSDKSVFGWKKLMKEEPSRAAVELDLIIKNTYRTLMTRGMKGCYIFSEDEETRDWFREI
ncbi:MAG: DUF2075 domain-containing protein [Sphingomonadales bacterium]|nr:DUF2075 domain-containing protein [Sphingomonadales bacterium]